MLKYAIINTTFYIGGKKLPNLLAASYSWTLDVAFFLIFFIGLFFGVKRGFVKSLSKLAGTFFSIYVAFTFCIAFQGTLENWFGLTTAIAQGVNSAVAGKWISVAIAFIALFIVVRLGAWLVGAIGTKLVNLFKPVRIVNMFLGGVLGLFQAFLFIILILSIFKWIPNEAIHNFISSSTIVGRFFEWDWFEFASNILPPELLPSALLP